MNPWAWIEYAHNMSGAMITGSFFMAAIGAFYLLSRRNVDYGRLFLKVGIIPALMFSVVQLFPTGDLHGKLLARYQPATPAVMETLWMTKHGAPIVIIGQPHV